MFLLNSFSALCVLVDLTSTLSISLLFDFISSLLLSFFLDIISFFSDEKESGYFFQLNIFSVFSVPD